MASTSARQKSVSRNASAITPTLASWRTFATVAAFRLRTRASSVSSHASESGHEVADRLHAGLDIELADEPGLVSMLPQPVVDEAGALHLLALLREPAPAREVAGEDVLFELLARLLCHADAPGHDPVAEEAQPAVE